MRRLNFTILFVLLLLLLATFSLATSSYSDPDIKITLLSQSPDPVEPGQVVSLKFKIENNGTETSKDTIIKILPNFPLSVYGDLVEKNLGKLRAGSTGADAVITEFKLKIDPAAVEEDTEIELELKTGDMSKLYVNDEFLIDVQTQDAILDITSITSEPGQIPAGEVANVDIMVKNQADSLLKDIKFKLDLLGGDLPFAPYQSSSERRVSQLESEYQNSLNFKLIVDPDAKSGLYKLPLNITYNDEKGNSYHSSDVLALVVGDVPKIIPFVKKRSVMQKEMGGKITLGLVNSGTIGVKYLE